MISYEGGQLIVNYGNPFVWVDLVVSLLLIISAFFLIKRILKRKFVYGYFIVGALSVLLGWLFSLRLFWSLSLVVLVVGLVIFIYVNIGEVRTLLANSLSSRNIVKTEEQKVFDRHAAYAKIYDAAVQLSKQKIGGLITIERTVKLDDNIKTGTILKAPIVTELLLTIFYPGSRLHDGAVVIRRDMIYAASVYYTPTTKPLTGKYGSRHRAAIGISEISDSVTIVVSEETGRISIAQGGELTPVTPDNLLRTLEDLLVENENEEKHE